MNGFVVIIILLLKGVEDGGVIPLPHYTVKKVSGFLQYTSY
jgi:hypothetical protein